MLRLISNAIALPLAALAVAAIIHFTRPGPTPCEAPANHGRECQSCERLRSQWASVDDEARAIVDSCEKE
jgi:hypothetical protein